MSNTPPSETRQLTLDTLRLPKAELHLHLEGTIGPETWLKIIRRHEPGSTVTLRELEARLRFTGAAGFFEAWMALLHTLKSPEDYRLAAFEAGRALSSQNVLYAEFHTSIAGAAWSGRLPADEVIPAIAEGLEAARREGGPAWRLIIDAIRDFLPQGTGEIALGLALRHRANGVAGIGLGGTEEMPAQVARDVFVAARAEGLHLTAHAGEQAGPESIWGTLEIGAERIGHAARAPEDPALVEYLLRNQVPLEMCPTSNVLMGAVPSLQAHPVGPFLRRGLNVSLSTDDPAFFGTDLSGEYARVAKTFALAPSEVARLARNAFEAAFLPEAEKTALLARFDAEIQAPA